MRDYSSPTSTIDLTTAAKAHPVLRRYHVGTYPLDALPKLTVGGRPRHIIYNLSPSTQPPGTHWVSIWLTRDMKAEVVDSLGQAPASREVVGFIRRHSTSASFCDTQLQGLTSNVCGLYALSHGLARARGQSLATWLRQFTSCPTDNDKLVQCQFMRELAIPSLFSPRLTHWRRKVEEACRGTSLPRASKQAGRKAPCRPIRASVKKLL